MEAAVERTEEVIKKEYAQACAQLGENIYRVAVLDNQIVQLKQRINDLNIEAEKLSKEQKNGKEQAN